MNTLKRRGSRKKTALKENGSADFTQPGFCSWRLRCPYRLQTCVCVRCLDIISSLSCLRFQNNKPARKKNWIIFVVSRNKISLTGFSAEACDASRDASDWKNIFFLSYWRPFSLCNEFLFKLWFPLGSTFGFDWEQSVQTCTILYSSVDIGSIDRN